MQLVFKHVKTQGIYSRYQSVLSEIETACSVCGRNADEVTLIAVVKGVAPQLINEAYEAGIDNFAENYVQEALVRERPASVYGRPQSWHLIGHLQRNKVRYITGRFDLIHSVDSAALAEEIARRAHEAHGVQDILLQVKLDTESETKHGVAIEDVFKLVDTVSQLEGIRLKGLMGIAPADVPAEGICKSFEALYNVFARLPEPARQVLSMGMSADFTAAIQAGATHIRVGTALFGPRT